MISAKGRNITLPGQHETLESAEKEALETVGVLRMALNDIKIVMPTDTGWALINRLGQRAAVVYVSEIVADDCGHDSCHGRKVCLYTY